MALIDSVFTSEIFVNALAGLLALLLVTATAVLARYLQRVGLQLSEERSEAVERLVVEGVLAARQKYRAEPDTQQTNAMMHASAVEHARQFGGKAARKLAARGLDAMVHAAVRRLKGIL